MDRLIARYTNSYLSYVLMYLFYNISFALFSAMLSVYLIGKGYSASDVSLCVSVGSLSAMVTQPIIGGLTDRFGMRPVNLTMFGIVCLAAVGVVIAPNFMMLVGSWSIINLLMNGANPVVERMATSSPYDYGKVRMWGTIGFACGTQLSGIIYDAISPDALFITLIFTMLLCILGFWGTQPRLAEAEEANIEAGDEAEPVSMKDLLTNKKFLYYLLLQVIFVGVTGAVYSFAPAFLTSKGMDPSFASTILAIATLCELPFIIFSSKYMDKVPNKILLLICFALVVVQMVTYGLDLPLPVIIVITFLCKHPPVIINVMANMKVVNTIVDARLQITGLALVKACQSFGTIVSNNIGGRIVDASGYPPMFLFLLAVIAVGLVGVVFFQVPSGNDKKLFS
ncbi:MAG: MFS transporter [Atopobiaceae bacterium]|nr:MFS transporter [Atopobiaceae bacterium]